MAKKPKTAKAVKPPYSPPAIQPMTKKEWLAASEDTRRRLKEAYARRAQANSDARIIETV